MTTEAKFFRNAIDKNRLSHLYLISGVAGAGKLDLVKNIAFMLLEKFDTRSNLESIIKLENHSQIHYVRPDGNVIKKEQILKLQEEFSKTSLIKGPRIYIIEGVDLISTSAANSLLKFMEEPDSDNVYGFLITSNISNVLKTIISRSQVIRVTNKDNNHVYDSLVKEEIDSYNARSISFITNDIDEAITYSNDDQLKIIIQFIKSFINDYNNKSFSPSLSITKEISSILFERQYYQIFLELLLINFLDVLKYLLNEDISFNENIDIYNNNYKNLESKIIINVINLIQEEISKLRNFINIGLSLDVLMINIK